MKSSLGKSTILRTTVIGSLAAVLVLILGTIWMGRSASRDTEQAVQTVSLFYLDELADRREQVVSNNLRQSVDNIYIAIGLMDEEDLGSAEKLQAYQARMKQLYGLEKFAFVDENGLIYTSQGPLDEIDQYAFDYRTLEEPAVSVRVMEDGEKRVVIAVPAGGLPYGDHTFQVCFMEIAMDRMLSGVSMGPDANETTFCNIYTPEGEALTNVVLGGLASEDNLLEAMRRASYEEGYSFEQLEQDFAAGREGVVSFTYNGILETLAYVPIEGTDWMLTYLIRESLIGEQISSVSLGIINRSLIQTILTTVVLLGMFALIIRQSRRNNLLALEKEAAATTAKVRQEELEQRVALQEQLLKKEQERARLERLITALSSDYKSVYYLDLDRDEGECFQSYEALSGSLQAGEHFSYMESVTAYANRYIDESYREGFLAFVSPESIREALRRDRVISYRYLIHQDGREAYEMVKLAGVRHPEDREDGVVHAVGACFTDVDRETRQEMEKSSTLSAALSTAEEASRAKTAFLSNMSHEIRTPMNAIIGLNDIALHDPDTPEKTKEYLKKMGESARHLLHIINDILNMSRIESGRLSVKNEEFSFSRALEQVNTIISGQCQEKGLRYVCRVNGKLDDWYIGDDMKLRQIMINILGNAVKFTPEGGVVTFTLGETTRLEGKAALRMIMTDTGIGMSPEYLPKLFDAFSQEDSSTTSRFGSTGLGMPITKNLVELMNGTIEVESEKGVGTTFIVTVTLGLSDHSREPEEDDIALSDMCVLVIDDDPVACEHARITLKQAGVFCETAVSGREGLEMVRMRHVRREPYNLILVDWKMPEMDGVETAREIRSAVGNETAIIILTAYSWDEIMDEARQAGVDTFVAKPLFAASVVDEFREAFRKKQAAGKPARADLNGRRILLAEDMPVNAEIMVMLLQMRGMEAEIAENGRVALEYFEKHPAGYYDAILMDMRMPEMDGLEATRRIRASQREDAGTIPIIALTANAFDEDVQRSMQAGLNAHLSKPVEPDVLYETLESLIR